MDYRTHSGRDAAYRTFRQSVVIHPDWSAADHHNYLVEDAFFDHLPLAVVEGWLADLKVRHGR